MCLVHTVLFCFSNVQDEDLFVIFSQNFCIAAKKLETVLRPQLNILNEDDFEATTVPNILQVILQFAHQQVTRMTEIKK